MKILHINHVDSTGGAAIATRRLVGAQRRLGLHSELLVDRCHDDESWIHSPSTSLGRLWAGQVRPGLDQIPVRLLGKNVSAPWGLNWLPTNARRRVAQLEPDLLNLHWISAGMLPLRDLSKIKVPVVWTLHDMWAFTGGCHFDRSCERYAHGCGRCPQLGSGFLHDLSHFNARKKRLVLEKTRPVLVSPSRWLAERARASSSCERARIEVIPNGIDRSRFHPRSKTSSRELFGLPPDTRVILFGAANALIDLNKGNRYFFDALEAFQARSKQPFLAVVFGVGASRLPSQLRFPIRSVGIVRDERAMAALFAAADVTVVPSEFENLPNVVLESLACGTPVVAFKIGGIPEIIEHKKNGWLAEPFESASLAAGLSWATERNLTPGLVSESVMAKFDIDLTAEHYRALYVEISESRRERNP